MDITNLPQSFRSEEYSDFFFHMTACGITPEQLKRMTAKEMLDEILTYKGIIGYTDFIHDTIAICDRVELELKAPVPPAFTLNSVTYAKLTSAGYLPSELQTMTAEELRQAYKEATK